MKLLLNQAATSTKPKSDSSSLDHFTIEQSAFLARFGREEVRETIAGLKPDQQLHFISRMYNMHDVFADLIKLSGPASVSIITYSITELPLRILSQFLDKKIILKLHLILDFTVARTPSLKQFADHMATSVKYIDVHSKILLIKGNDINITMLSSANFTRNNRFENGLISTSAELFEQYHNWFNQLNNRAND